MPIFGSTTIVAHLVRGAVGIGALVGASLVSGSYPWIWLVAVPIALVAFRGCPMCWMVGLAETVIGTAGPKGRAAAFVESLLYTDRRSPGAYGTGVHCPRCDTETSRQPRNQSHGGPA